MRPGVVPQQPPMMFRKPCSRPLGDFLGHGSRAIRRTRRIHSAGRRWDGPRRGCRRCGESSSMYGRSCLAPSAQLRPKESGRAWRERIPERLDGLARERAAGGIGDGAGNHDRQRQAVVLGRTSPRQTPPPWRSACRIPFRSAGYRRRHRPAPRVASVVGIDQFIEVNVAEAGVVHVGRNGRRAAGRTEHAGHEAGTVRRPERSWRQQAARARRVASTFSS